MQGLKINECGDQIVPIPIQRNNCIESVRLRKEILVNSAKMQESVQPLVLSYFAPLGAWEVCFAGDLPSAKDFRKLVNLENVKKSIGDPVTEDQKQEITKDLEKALDDFIDRETESTDVSFIIPFVTVNNRTDIVAIHSRLLLALQLSVVQSVRRLNIEPDSSAFNEVGWKIYPLEKLKHLCSSAGKGGGWHL